MSHQVSLQQRLRQLQKAGANLDQVCRAAAKQATLRAVEAAANATPPKAGTGRGVALGANTVSGELKAHWDADSQKEPQKTAAGWETILANNKDYASYVNDGHRLDRHFVPGLYIDPHSGQLKRDIEGKKGLVVGTKTKYVKGEFMVDKAKAAYEDTLLAELDRHVREVIG